MKLLPFICILNGNFFESLSKQIVTGSNDSMVYVWNLNQSGNIYKFLGHRVNFYFIKDAITDVQFSPLGNQIASVSKD